jgi:AcrR family transcriptional regulator
VAVGSVYHVFPNKEELLMAVMTPMFQSVFQTNADQFIDQTLGKKYDSFSDFISSLVKDRIHFIDANFKILKVMFGELLTKPDLRAQIKEIFAKQLFQSSLPVLDQFKKQNVLVDWPN